MWAYEVLGYWEQILREYAEHGVAPFNGREVTLARKLEDGRFGYLSRKDRLLIHDTVSVECDAFLTMDNRLAKNGGHLERELGLRVLSPIAHWTLLQAWAALDF